MTIIIAEGLCKSTNRGDSAGRCGKDRTHEFVENSQAASGGPHGVPAGGIADHGAAGRVNRPRCADGGHRYKLYFPPCRGLSAGMAVPASDLAAAGLDLPAAAVVYAGHGGTGLRTLRGEFLYPAAAR